MGSIGPGEAVKRTSACRPGSTRRGHRRSPCSHRARARHGPPRRASPGPRCSQRGSAPRLGRRTAGTVAARWSCRPVRGYPGSIRCLLDGRRPPVAAHEGSYTNPSGRCRSYFRVHDGMLGARDCRSQFATSPRPSLPGSPRFRNCAPGAQYTPLNAHGRPGISQKALNFRSWGGVRLPSAPLQLYRRGCVRKKSSMSCVQSDGQRPWFALPWV